MLDRFRITVVVATVLWLAVAVPLVAEVDPVEVEKATRTILCDCGCHPQSVHDCACGRAAEMRAEMTQLVEGGMTGEQVLAKYVDERGKQILVAPTADGFNLVAWTGPFVALLIGGSLVLFILRRWARTHSSTITAPVPIPATDNAYVKRLQEQLKEFE